MSNDNVEIRVNTKILTDIKINYKKLIFVLDKKNKENLISIKINNKKMIFVLDKKNKKNLIVEVVLFSKIYYC